MKTSELVGAALDWAVCMANGMKPEDIHISNLGGKHISLYTLLRDDDGNLTGKYMTGPDLLFSRKWESGGPIIDREKIDIEGYWNVRGCGVRTSFKEWRAIHPKNHGGLIRYTGYGPTALIAAMRCYVASKLGDSVDIPEELT